MGQISLSRLGVALCNESDLPPVGGLSELPDFPNHGHGWRADLFADLTEAETLNPAGLEPSVGELG